MAKALPLAAQSKILKLQRRVFTLEQQIARLKAKHEQETAKLKTEIETLKEQPIFVSEKKLRELQERRQRALKNT